MNPTYIGEGRWKIYGKDGDIFHDSVTNNDYLLSSTYGGHNNSAIPTDRLVEKIVELLNKDEHDR